MYEYRCNISDVIDGDTVVINLDLGCDVWLRGLRIRIWGINTPEIRGGTPETKAKGHEAKDALIKLITTTLLTHDTLIRTHKDKKDGFGRYLGEILLVPRAEGDLATINVGDWLLRNGYAEEYRR